MNADQIIENMLKLREQTLEEKNLVELELLDPTNAVRDAIVEAGGKIAREKYERTCHSSTCNCNSHDPGQSSTVVIIPRDWIIKMTGIGELSKVFNVKDDDSQNPLFLVPGEKPALVVSYQEDHWAGNTYLHKHRINHE